MAMSPIKRRLALFYVVGKRRRRQRLHFMQMLANTPLD
jgi:hypothetical protein